MFLTLLFKDFRTPATLSFGDPITDIYIEMFSADFSCLFTNRIYGFYLKRMSGVQVIRLEVDIFKKKLYPEIHNSFS